MRRENMKYICDAEHIYAFAKEAYILGLNNGFDLEFEALCLKFQKDKKTKIYKRQQ